MRRQPWTLKRSTHFSPRKSSGVMYGGAIQLPNLIASVHRTLGDLGQPNPPEEVLTPAVSVRQSVRPEFVTCLDCGYRGKTLRRHISTRHGFDRDEYLKRWGLRHDHPLTAPAYSEHRSTLAKQLGLGRKPKAKAAATSIPAESVAANVNGEVEANPKPNRATRSGSNSEVVNEAALKPTKTRQRRARSRAAPPQSEPVPTPTPDA